jgi:hypothetical protein
MQPAEDDDVEGVVGGAVAAAVEAVAVGLSAAGEDGRDATQVRECCFGVQPVGVVAEGGQECPATSGPTPGRAIRRGAAAVTSARSSLSASRDLGAEVVVAAGQAAQRGLGAVVASAMSPVGRSRAHVAISAVVVSVRSCSRSSAGR